MLARGEKEIEAGIGYEMDEVLKEADRFLGELKNLENTFFFASTTPLKQLLTFTDNPSAAEAKAEKTSLASWISGIWKTYSRVLRPSFAVSPYHRFFYKVKDGTV